MSANGAALFLVVHEAVQMELSGNERRRIADRVFDFVHVEQAWTRIWPDHDAITRPCRPYVRSEFLDNMRNRIAERVAKAVLDQNNA